MHFSSTENIYSKLLHFTWSSPIPGQIINCLSVNRQVPGQVDINVQNVAGSNVILCQLGESNETDLNSISSHFHYKVVFFSEVTLYRVVRKMADFTSGKSANLRTTPVYLVAKNLTYRPYEMSTLIICNLMFFCVKVTDGRTYPVFVGMFGHK